MTDRKKRIVVARSFCGDDDFMRVRNLLDRTYPITPIGFNWEVRRWDGFRYYNADPTWNPDWEKQVCLWETTDGELVAAVHPEGTGHVHIQLHPEYRQVEADIISWAENNLASIAENGGRELFVFAFEYDAERIGLLEERGYARTDKGEVIRWRQLDNGSIEQPSIADGYVMRTVRPDNDQDCDQIAKILNAAFNRNIHTAAEFRSFATHAASCREGLDLVAVANDGTFAAYVGAPYNEANLYGLFEPVCTHPDHRRKGLAHALMSKGLIGLQSLGAKVGYVGTGAGNSGNRFYQSLGFEQSYTGFFWRKTV